MRRLTLVFAAALLFAACGDDSGGTEAGATSADVATESTLAGTDTELTSPAFSEGDSIPVANAGCDGPNEVPALEWIGVPGDAEQLAVTMFDPDADFVHWVIVGLDPASDGLDVQGDGVPAGAVEALNGTGQPGYFGPCPPETHTYVFTVHALSADPGVTADMGSVEALNAVEAATTIGTELSGTYTPEG